MSYILLRDNEAMKTKRGVGKGIDLGSVFFSCWNVNVM